MKRRGHIVLFSILIIGVAVAALLSGYFMFYRNAVLNVSSSSSITESPTWTGTVTYQSSTYTLTQYSFPSLTTSTMPPPPIYYAPLGNQCANTIPFHDALLEIHIITQDGKYVYNGLNTRIIEYVFGAIPIPILWFEFSGRTYSSGGVINYNGICVDAPSSFGWVDVITVSVLGSPSITFNWHPVSGEHSVIEIVYPQVQIVVKQGTPQISS